MQEISITEQKPIEKEIVLNKVAERTATVWEIQNFFFWSTDEYGDNNDEKALEEALEKGGYSRHFIASLMKAFKSRSR